MHNVLSDEKEKEPSTSTSTSSPSVLTKRGAGKRVQLAKILAQPSSPPKEPEIIGEGLPLMQRLRLLKQKEDREKKQEEEREAMMQTLMPATQKPKSPPQSTSSAAAAPEPSSAPSVAPAAAPPVKSRGNLLLKSFVKTKVCVEAPPPSTTVGSSDSSSKETLKPLTSAAKGAGAKRESISSVDSGSTVSSPPSSSLAKRALSPPLKPGGLLIGEAAAMAASRATTEPISISAPPMPPKLSSQISFSPPISSGSMSPPVMDIVSVGRDRSASASSALAPSTMQPSTSSFMRPAALHFRQKTYGSVDDLSPEFSRLPFVKKLKILNERQKIAAILVSKTGGNILTRSTSEGSNENTTVAGSRPPVPTSEEQLHAVAMGRRSQSTQEPLLGPDDEGGGGDGADSSLVPSTSTSTPKSSCSAKKYDQSPPEREIRSVPVSDQSGGIQERSTTQHQSTSSSAQPTSTTTCLMTNISAAHDSNTTKCLTKLGTDDQAPSTFISSTNSCKILPSRLSPSPTSLHVGGSGSKKRKKTKKIHASASPTSEKKEDDGNSSSSSSSTPSPPELDSSETPERRNLKSILKRLAKSEEAVESEPKRGDTALRRLDERKLLKAPTIEGYAARHRKFAKNVTFHRQAVTVVSPEEVLATHIKIPSRPGGKDSKFGQTPTEAMQICQMSDVKICDEPSDTGTGIATQTEQLIPVCEHSYIPDVSSCTISTIINTIFMHNTWHT